MTSPVWSAQPEYLPVFVLGPRESGMSGRPASVHPSGLNLKCARLDFVQILTYGDKACSLIVTFAPPPVTATMLSFGELQRLAHLRQRITLEAIAHAGIYGLEN